MITNSKKTLKLEINQRGERLTKQRQFILEYLNKVTNHPSAEIVYQEIKKKLPQISLGTVYRNLKYLVDNGYIRQLISKDDKFHFDANTSYHLHFICGECGKVWDLQGLTINKNFNFIKEKIKKYGQVQWLECNFYGKCKKCK